MKNKSIILLLALVLLLSCSLGANAAEYKSVTVEMDPSVTILIDGEPFIAKNSDNQFIYPFIVGGNTYLPVRALSGAAGYDVEWVGATTSIYLTPSAEPTALYSGAGTPAFASTKLTGIYRPEFKIYFNNERFYPMRDGQSVDPIVVLGSTFLPLRVICERAGFVVGWDGATRTITLTSPQGADEYPAAGEAPQVKTGWARVNYWAVSNQPGFYKGYNDYVPQLYSQLPGAKDLNAVIAAQYDAAVRAAENKSNLATAGNSGYAVYYETSVDTDKQILSVILHSTTMNYSNGSRSDGVQVFHYNYALDQAVSANSLLSMYGISGDRLVSALKADVGVYGAGGSGKGEMPPIKAAWKTTIAENYNNLNFFRAGSEYVLYYIGQYYGINTLGRGEITAANV